MHLMFLLLAALGGVLAWRWLQRQPTAVRRTAGIKIALGVIGTLALAGVLTGRLNPMTLLITAAAAVPMLGRLLDVKQLFDRMKPGGGARQAKQSTVATDFLEMTLNHDSGEMGGRVVRGKFQGQELHELDLSALHALLRECAPDPQSVRILEAYLDRTYGPQWRGAGSDEPGRAAAAGMSVEQAREILDLGPGANREQVVAAHRSLMQKLHPDRGGSTFLAAQVNQAKEVLLANLQ
jgi:hypothetical protein